MGLGVEQQVAPPQFGMIMPTNLPLHCPMVMWSVQVPKTVKKGLLECCSLVRGAALPHRCSNRWLARELLRLIAFFSLLPLSSFVVLSKLQWKYSVVRSTSFTWDQCWSHCQLEHDRDVHLSHTKSAGQEDDRL